MGLLSLFKKDWPAELDRVVRYLDDEQPVLALDLLRKIEPRVAGYDLQRTRSLASRAKTELMKSLLDRARAAEDEGKLSDAADWLLAAIERCDGESQTAELEARREELLNQLEVNPFDGGPAEGTFLETSTGLDDEVEIHFDAIVETLIPSVADLYRDRSPEFRGFIVALNQGDTDVALAGLEALIGSEPPESPDPVLRLERGRAYLIRGELEAARADFEHAWGALGPEPLDSAGVLSVPVLWAESTLAENPTAVADRLRELAAPGNETIQLAQLYAESLLQLEDYEAVRPYLRSMLRRYPSEVSFALLYAQTLAAHGETDEAIACLEAAVGPSCGSGQCAAGPRHIPAIRALAELQLSAGEKPERCAELMAIIAQTQGGQLGAADHQILGRYYRVMGDEAAAEHAESEASRLAAAGPTAEAVPSSLGTGQQRVL